MALQQGADTLISTNEREFIIQALKADRRIDGRGPFDTRQLNFQFTLDDASCTVTLGATRVMAVISATLEPPYPDRPSEGSLRFNVEFSPMASPAFDTGRPGEAAIELARLVERGLKESRAIDLEALCVQAGRRVWHLRADVHILDNCGNLADACGLAALGALCAFKRPDVTVNAGHETNSVIVHSTAEKEPVSLTIHHLPLAVSFAFFEEGELLVMDPSIKEEMAATGMFTVTINPAGELCAVQKVKGVGVSHPQLMRCIRLAARKVSDLVKQLKKALEVHEVARVQSRIRRHTPATALGATVGGAQQQQQQQQKVGNKNKMPADIERVIAEANAIDTTSSEEEEDAEELQQEQQEQDAEMLDVSTASEPTTIKPAAAVMPSVGAKTKQPPSTDKAAVQDASTTSSGRKKKKQRKSHNGDEYAAVAATLAAQGGGSGDGGAKEASLKDAVKKKKKKNK